MSILIIYVILDLFYVFYGVVYHAMLYGEHNQLKKIIDHVLITLKFDSIPSESLSSIKKGRQK